MMHDFFTISFAPYAASLFLLIFLCFGSIMDAQIQKIFFLLWISEFAELTFHNLELWTSTFAAPGFARMLFSAIGYSVRILSIYLVLLLSMRNRLTTKSRILWAVPVFLNVLTAFSVFFSDITYSFSSDNHFQRGPLGYTSHIVFLFYLTAIFFILIRDVRRRPLLESITICAITLFIAASIIISTAFAVDGLGCTATILSTVFYYMFFQSQVYTETLYKEQKMREGFEKKSKTDGMTGLLNKNAFADAVNVALHNDFDQCIALIFIDLDNFKSVNDHLGHLIGDDVLKSTAKKLQNLFRNADIVGRFGGDEFCAFLRDIPREILCQRLDEILLELQMEYSNGTNTVQITASMGAVYCTSERNLNLDFLLALADKAVYEAKSKSRNCYVIHECNT